MQKGREFLENHLVGWEWVNVQHIKTALRRSPVPVAVYAWETNSKGEYIKLGNPNHYCVLVAYDDFDRAVIWDSYEQNIKLLEKNYELEFPMLWTLRRTPRSEYYSRDFFGKLLLIIKQFTLWKTD